LLYAQVVATYSGSRGVTTTAAFQVDAPNWRIEVTYFRNWSPFWNLEVHVLRPDQESPVFSTRVVRYVDPMGRESWVPESQPSLSEGRYFLRVYSVDVDWIIRVVKGGR